MEQLTRIVCEDTATEMVPDARPFGNVIVVKMLALGVTAAICTFHNA